MYRADQESEVEISITCTLEKITNLVLGAG